MVADSMPNPAVVAKVKLVVTGDLLAAVRAHASGALHDRLSAGWAVGHLLPWRAAMRPVVKLLFVELLLAAGPAEFVANGDRYSAVIAAVPLPKAESAPR